jgi:hypothetical protein
LNRSCGSEGGGGVEAQATTTAAHNLSEVFNDCTVDYLTPHVSNMHVITCDQRWWWLYLRWCYSGDGNCSDGSDGCGDDLGYDDDADSYG